MKIIKKKTFKLKKNKNVIQKKANLGHFYKNKKVIQKNKTSLYFCEKNDKNFISKKLTTNFFSSLDFSRLPFKQKQQYWKFLEEEKKKNIIKLKINLKFMLKLKKKFSFKHIFFKHNFFFFLSKVFSSFTKKGKKNIMLNIFLKMFKIINLKKKYFLKKSKVVYVYILQIIVKIMPIFLNLNRMIKGKRILLPWLHRKNYLNKKKTSILAANWIKKAIYNRKEKTYFLKIISELEDIRLGRGESLNFKQNYYKNFYDNKQYVRTLRRVNAWI